MIAPLLLAMLAAHAWDSDADGEAGAAAARATWTGEHADFMAAALAAFGVRDPADARVRVYTDGLPFDDGVPTVGPASDWAAVADVQERAYALSWFADLPDLAWSVAGWLDGNETCPVAGSSRARCFGLQGWLGAGLNASHFLPQAGAAHGWYHTLALDTADRCAAMAEALEDLDLVDPSLTASVLEPCEAEALMFEGTGQHYLQDGWASAHMWQRWGSTEPGDWLVSAELLDYARALAVGTMSGLIHGFKLLVIETPLRTGSTVRCLPGGASTDERCVGDGHGAELTASFPEQDARLWACVLGSVDEVVARLPGALGGVSTGLGLPDESACFGQRVTNGAMRSTFFFSTIGAPSALQVIARLVVGWDAVPDISALAEPDRSAVERDLRVGAVRAAILLRASAWSRANPDTGTNLADGILHRDDGTDYEITALGMRPNAAYLGSFTADAGVSTYDPPVDVVTGARAGTAAQEERAAILRRAVPAAHADSWCAGDLAGDVSTLAGRCRDTTLDETARAASCDACGELGAWLHLDGSGPDEPGEHDALCAAFDGGAGQRLYLPASRTPLAATSTEAAGAWCGHGCATRVSVVAVDPADAGVDYDEVLSAYLTDIEAKIIGTRAYAEYWLSTGQYSLWEYYDVVASNFEYDLIAIARLLAAARYKENALARWQGGFAGDDYYGALDATVGVSEHAVAAGATSLSWETDLGDLPIQTVLYALEADDEYPFLFMGSARPTVEDEDGEVTLRMKDLLFITSTYLHDATLTVAVDGRTVATLENVVSSPGEVALPLGTGGLHRLTFDVAGHGLSDSDLYSDDYDQDLAFRILALDILVESPEDGETCGLW